ncbi:uncharacterized protein EI90DRAFT_3081093 [Cantharellus anzutake]|uniref:uncharacterized protein n=1 Tax=Cantharellus anzutake TaxID=1750568 RepID=UPI001908E720|nr:uncharacterized protein EI90DRAFT_3081093 [Cantharellus anzutake]KAF8320228.1 hypothetical protein EI90DRAFT_3081093 [Cantharellus anzutake]
MASTKIAAVIAEIHEVSEISKTQTNKELTGYAGVSDWGKEALEARSAFLNAMTVICVLGAGLSYSSTMSALRGNISYMCYSFALFMIGLVVITLVQVVLTWCSQRSNYPFAAPFFWDFVIDILQCGAFATAAAAIILLMVSVQVLVVPNSSTSDAIRTFSPKPAAYATYAVCILCSCLRLTHNLAAIWHYSYSTNRGSLCVLVR